MIPSDAERALAWQINAIDATRFVAVTPEYRFAPPRRWRFDFAWPHRRIAVEVEGGSWIGGAHTRGKHFESDMEKYNEAALLGWTVIRVTPAMVTDGRALDFIERAFKREAA